MSCIDTESRLTTPSPANAASSTGPGEGPVPEVVPEPVVVPLYAHVFRGLLAGWFVALTGGVVIEWLGYTREFARLAGVRGALDTIAVSASVASVFGIAYGLSRVSRRRIATPAAAAAALVLAVLAGRYLATSLGDPIEAVMRTLWDFDLKAGRFLVAGLLPTCGLFAGLRLAEDRGVGLLGEVRAAALGGAAGAITALPGVGQWGFRSLFVYLVILVLVAGLTPLGLRVGALLVNKVASRLNGSLPWPRAGAELLSYLKGFRADPSLLEAGDWRGRARALLQPAPGLSELYRMLAFVFWVCLLALLVGVLLGSRGRGDHLSAWASGAGFSALLAYGLCWETSSGLASPRWRGLAAACAGGCLAAVLWHGGHGAVEHVVCLGLATATLTGLLPWRLGVAILGLFLSAFAWIPFLESVGVMVDPIVRVSYRTLPGPPYPVASGLVLLALALPWRARGGQFAELAFMLAFGILGAMTGIRLASLPGAWRWDYDLLFRGLSLSILCAVPAAALGAWVRRRLGLALISVLLLGALTHWAVGYEQRARELPFSEVNTALLVRAEAGDLEAAYTLGRNLRWGIGEGDWEGSRSFEGWRWVRVAAAGGHPEAMYRYGLALERGRDLRRDVVAGRAWIERAARAGSPRAKDWLAEADD